MAEISLLNAQPIDLSKAKVVKLNDEQMAEFKRMRLEMEALQYQKPIIPEDKTFAEVVVNGKVIATVTNNGYVQTSNAWGGRINGVIAHGKGQGPNLAQWRAEAIAKAFGGRVEMADTALNQAEWQQLPKPTWTIDTEKMLADGYADAAKFKGRAFHSMQLATSTIAAILDMEDLAKS